MFWLLKDFLKRKSKHFEPIFERFGSHEKLNSVN